MIAILNVLHSPSAVVAVFPHDADGEIALETVRGQFGSREGYVVRDIDRATAERLFSHVEEIKNCGVYTAALERYRCGCRLCLPPALCDCGQELARSGRCRDVECESNRPRRRRYRR